MENPPQLPVLRKTGGVVVPEVTEASSTSEAGGYPDINKTLQAIRKDFTLPGLAQDVRNYIKFWDRTYCT